MHIVSANYYYKKRECYTSINMLFDDNLFEGTLGDASIVLCKTVIHLGRVETRINIESGLPNISGFEQPMLRS